MLKKRQLKKIESSLESGDYALLATLAKVSKMTITAFFCEKTTTQSRLKIMEALKELAKMKADAQEGLSDYFPKTLKK